MSSVALYRKYRSKTFDELIGQDHIRASLLNALKAGRISHAYLFSGPRGVGKTSTARLLARHVNQLPDGDDISSHLDIIEIDAASNRRIDEIRDLREKVHVAPAQAKYKVYIVDEVHMLTTEAFNALLKTLEEPPSHAIFVLATTEPQKLPETIISRTQRFNFRPVPEQRIADHLASIAKKEKINISKDALLAIGRAGQGSVRDSIGILDQAASLSAAKKKITTEDIAGLLGQTDPQIIAALTDAVDKSDGPALLKTLDELWAQGAEPIQIVEQLTQHYRNSLRQIIGGGDDSTLVDFYSKLINGLAQLPVNSAYLHIALEALLLTATQSAPAKKPVERSDEAASPSVEPAKKSEATRPKKDAPTPEDKANEPKSFDDTWIRVLSVVREQNNSLYALLRTGDPVLEQDTLTVNFRFQFHKGRLEETHNLKIVQEALRQVAGRDISVKTEVTPKQTGSQATPQKDDVSTILQVFGGEVMQ